MMQFTGRMCVSLEELERIVGLRAKKKKPERTSAWKGYLVPNVHDISRDIGSSKLNWGERPWGMKSNKSK